MNTKFQKNINFPKLIEVTGYVASAGGSGYRLLELYKSLHPDALIPKKVFCFSNGKKSSSEDWLSNIVNYLLSKEVEITSKYYIKTHDAFLDFLESMNDTNKEYLKDYLLEEICEYLDSYGEYDHLDEVSEDCIEDFLLSNPLRINTLSSKLFDTNTRLVHEAKKFIINPLMDELKINLDLFGGIFVNDNSLGDCITDSDYRYSIAIVTRPLLSSWHDLNDSFNIPELSVSCVDELIDAYLDLLNN